MEPLNHQSISGRSVKGDYYTPRSFYNLMAGFFQNDFIDLACDEAAYNHREPVHRPTYYQSEEGWYQGNVPDSDVPVFCNPPGGRDKQLKYQLFNQAMHRHSDGAPVLWLVYNINSLQPLTRMYPDHLNEASLLLFSKRLEWENKAPGDSGSFFASAALYWGVPKYSQAWFKSWFNHLGVIKQ